MINKQLALIQAALVAPKSQHNKFGNYSYRSAEDILEAVKPLLGELSLVISDEMVEVGGRVYVRATATLTAESGSVSACGYAREPLAQKGMSEPQVTGSASSYARKYSLNGLFCIDDTKDADHNSQSGNSEMSVRRASTKQIEFVRNLVQQKWNVNDFRKKFNVMSAEDLTAQQASEAIEFINQQVMPEGN